MRKLKKMLNSEKAHLTYMTVVSVVMVVIIIYQLKIGAYPVNTE